MSSHFRPLSYQFSCPKPCDYWYSSTPPEPFIIVGNLDFDNIYMFAIGELGLMQIGIRHVSIEHAMRLAQSRWFRVVPPLWLRIRMKGSLAIKFLGTLPKSYTFSNHQYMDYPIILRQHV